jgi:hypothetical protein
MNQAQAVVTIAAELRLFLRPGRRGGPVAVPWTEPRRWVTWWSLFR